MKNRIRFALATILLTLASLAARAGGRTEWLSIIDAVLANGVTQVGDFNVAAFRRQAQHIKWGTFAGSPESVRSGSRISGYYNRGKGQAYLSAQLPNGESASLAQIELHEALGATGYNDNDYSLTIALGTLAVAQSTGERNHLLQSYSGIFRKTIHVAIGGTGVSGGGDEPTLSLKQEVLNVIRAGDFGSVSREFLAQYPLIEFEPLRSSSTEEVVLKYNSFPHGNRAGRRESLSVWVPMNRWNASGPGRAALVQEIAQKITGVFPARGGAVRTFHPRDCGPGVTATYPATNDPVIADIQNRRAEVQNNCRMNFPGETGEEYMAPGIPKEEQPRTPGHFVFDCQFRYGQAHIEYQLNAAQGLRSLNSQGWSIDGNDSINGMSAVSRQGQLEFVIIMYHGTDGQMRRSTAVKAQGGAAMTSMDINGQTLTYECHASR